jgi:predicted nucleic acid-binding Zn ribbon protein
MRRRPVTRSEIRFNGRHITTLPVDAVRKNDFGRIAPIRELWGPLLRSLNQWRERDDGQAQAFQASGLPTRPRKRTPIRLPVGYVRPEPRLCTCQQCSREFYCVYGSGRYCSDRCAETSWRETPLVKARSEPCRSPPPERHCAICNKPFAAHHTTMRYCSPRCRTAAYRDRKLAKLGRTRRPRRGRPPGPGAPIS